MSFKLGGDENQTFYDALHGVNVRQRCIFPRAAFNYSPYRKYWEKDITKKRIPSLSYMPTVQIFGGLAKEIRLDILLAVVLVILKIFRLYFFLQEHLGLSNIPPPGKKKKRHQLCENKRCLNPHHYTHNRSLAFVYEMSKYKWLDKKESEYEVVVALLQYLQTVSYRRKYLPQPILFVYVELVPGTPFKRTKMILIAHDLYFA